MRKVDLIRMEFRTNLQGRRQLRTEYTKARLCERRKKDEDVTLCAQIYCPLPGVTKSQQEEDTFKLLPMNSLTVSKTLFMRMHVSQHDL